MAAHQHAPNANELWTYYRNVIQWVSDTFTVKRAIMKGLNWGALYDVYGKVTYDTKVLEDEISRLLIDDDVSAKKGIYSYVLTRNERSLNLRTFTQAQKLTAYERQDGICVKCGKRFSLAEMEADHITPWSKGGKTIPENCQMLCRICNRLKSDV